MFIEFPSGYLGYCSFGLLSPETFLNVVDFVPEVRLKFGIREHSINYLNPTRQPSRTATSHVRTVSRWLPGVWNKELGYVNSVLLAGSRSVRELLGKGWKPPLDDDRNHDGNKNRCEQAHE